MDTDKAQEKYNILSNCTDEELELELERRKKSNTRPVLNENADLTALKATCQSVIDDVVNGNYHEDNDDKYYIYEAAMIAFFGKDVFKWICDNEI